jgi:hypothetical protein
MAGENIAACAGATTTPVVGGVLGETLDGKVPLPRPTNGLVLAGLIVGTVAVGTDGFTLEEVGRADAGAIVDPEDNAVGLGASKVDVEEVEVGTRGTVTVGVGRNALDNAFGNALEAEGVGLSKLINKRSFCTSFDALFVDDAEVPTDVAGADDAEEGVVRGGISLPKMLLKGSAGGVWKSSNSSLSASSTARLLGLRVVLL